ncbi:MATE family efflux transporter [Radicibacter daui]|uniref:MATE family efflux transporter n=1 Tax=Radicibacter daui TaxID=3064829 RepID=UPI004046C405
MSAHIAPYTRQEIMERARALMRLAGPVVVSRLAVVAMLAIDVVILGRAGPDQMADFILGATLYDCLVPVLIGLLSGGAVIAARSVGQGHPQRCGAVWRRSLFLGFTVALAIAMGLQFAEPLLRLLGQTPEMAASGAPVTRLIALALPFVGLYIASTSLLEALKRPLPGMVAIIIANVVNAAVNIVLVHGKLGFPALGALGAATATLVVNILLATGMAAYVWWMPNRDFYGIRKPEHGPAGIGTEQRRLGYATAVSSGFEASSFSVLTLIAGMLGTLALAAQSVAFQFLLLPFMVFLSFGVAAQVEVGHAWGRGDRRVMALSGWMGLGMGAAIPAALAVLYMTIPEPMLALFTDDRDVIGLAAPLLPWVAVALLTDGGQVVMNLSCRGRGDAWFPTACHFGSYYGVMIPLAFILTFLAGQGQTGIFQAVFLASLVSFSAMAGRFWWLSHRISPAKPARTG